MRIQSLAIDPFDRMMLMTDGTVTTLLEACTGEPIATRTVRQAGPASLDVAAPYGFVTLCPNPSALTLAAGQSATVTIVAQVLANAPAGTFVMHASADPYNLVQESNENNNTTLGAESTIY